MKFLLFSFVLWRSISFAAYHSQCGQDRFVYENYFKDYREGVFIDIGAHDGVSLSNTLFFEEELDWTGICIEPNPKVFPALKNNRKAICIQGSVSDEAGECPFLNISGPLEMLSGLIGKFDFRHLERIHRDIAFQGGSYEWIDVNCYLLNEILENQGISHVHFLSLDTEGGEFEILASLDFSRFQIDVITVEDNYNDPRFIPFLSEKGFRFVQTLDQDLIFLNNYFYAH